MTRWFLLLFSLCSLGLMFFGPSSGWVIFGVAGFLVGSVATALAFAQARIGSSAREENLQLYESATRRRPESPPAPSAPGSGQPE